MKKLIAAFLTSMVLAGAAYAAEAPVALTQTLAGYTQNGRTVTLEYDVQVKNQREASLGPLTLTLVPQTPFLLEKQTFTVDELRPNGVAALKVRVVTPMLLNKKYFSRIPLVWGGKYADANGKLVEFPVTSRTGGAK